MHNYEIEVKSLLGSKERADEVKGKILEKGAVIRGSHKQLNHYFNAPEDLKSLYDLVSPIIEEDKKEPLKKITEEGKKVSVRTRDADGKVIFIIKASVGDDSSANGVSRIEFESKVSMTLDELDKILLDAGLTYQAKWSREREEFEMMDMQITIDKNAGYGYLAEFEKIGNAESDTGKIEKEIRDFMSEIGVEELKQDRLERMFDFYNKNWKDYYGTDKVFNIE